MVNDLTPNPVFKGHGIRWDKVTDKNGPITRKVFIVLVDEFKGIGFYSFEEAEQYRKSHGGEIIERTRIEGYSFFVGDFGQN